MRRSLFRRSSPHSAAAPVPFSGRRIGRTRVPLHRRLLIARSALAYWMAVLVLALVTAAVVSRLVSRAAAAERRLGSTRPALVTTRALRTGQRVTDIVARLEQRPAMQVPAGALRSIPSERSVSGPVARGEILTSARLEDRSVPERNGTVAMAVPRGDAPLAVRPGDRVDVYATYDPSLDPQAGATSRVADHAEVMRSSRASITISVREAEVTRLVTAVARSTLTVVLER